MYMLCNIFIATYLAHGWINNSCKIVIHKSKYKLIHCTTLHIETVKNRFMKFKRT